MAANIKIIGGRLGGRRLKAPAGRATRPTSAKVREALFNLLGPVDGLVTADLFAGSGALGLEALSRGADSLVAVDAAASALAAIKANIESLGAAEAVTPLRRDLSRGFGFLSAHGPFDLILADPPYRQGWVERLTAGLTAEFFSPTGRLVIESAPEEMPTDPAGWLIIKQRRYGDNGLTILAREAK